MLTLAEAAELLHLDPGTLRVQIHNGKLKAKKLGRFRMWVVTEQEVQRYARESRRLQKEEHGPEGNEGYCVCGRFKCLYMRSDLMVT